MTATDVDVARAAAEYVDSDHPHVVEIAQALAETTQSRRELAIALYGYVRDGVRYEPYQDYTTPEAYRASSVLSAGHGYCVGKAALLAALCRAGGIAARVGLADVRNHLSTPRLLATIGTDLFSYHGFTEIHLDGTWIKASPTFNATLCEKLSVEPLAFDGVNDALMQSHDRAGRTFMNYVEDHGRYHDVPAKFLIGEMRRLYPRLCVPGGLRGVRMEAEAGR